jgi:hypothetical protein
MQANAFACAFALLIPLVLPWRYVIDRYLVKAGDPWRGDRAQRAECADAGVSIR